MNSSLDPVEGTELSQEPAEESSQAPPTRYWIDLAWYEQRGRSFAALLETRRCYNCLDEIGDKRARSQFEGGSNTPARMAADQAWKRIQECCAHTHEFLSPRLPLLEAVFRLFLANGNAPLPVQEIAERLVQRHSDYDIPRTVSVEALKRVIEADDHYGVRPYPETPAKKAGADASLG